MREPGQESSTTAGRGRTPKQDARFSWPRVANDSLLALAGVALVTVTISAAHLYPRLPSILLIYLLVIIALASTRGGFAALLTAVLAGISFDSFLTPPSDLIRLEDLLDPDSWVFLVAAITSGQITAAWRRYAEQARDRASEARLLSEHAQELATLQERQHLALELHDSLSQTLYGINLGAHIAREALDSHSGKAMAPLEYVISLAEAGLTEMRALILELHPESLAIEGLIVALSKQVDVLRTRYKLSVDAQLGEEPDLSLGRKHAVYRITQEALHNIVKHACARTVLLRLSQQDGELILEVGDDGKGFDPAGTFPGHLGLHSIQERATQLGGTCSIESAPAQGTRLRVCVPVHDEPGSGVEEGKRH